MNSTLRFFITVASSIAVLSGYCKLNNKANLPKAERHKQFAMPIVAFVFVIVLMFFINGLYMKLIQLFNFLAGLAAMVPFLGSILSRITSLIALDSGKAWLLNIALFTIYLTLKKIVLPILSKLWEIPKVAQVTSEYFYDFDDENSLYFVKRYLANVREFVKGMYYGLIVVSSIIFTISIRHPSSIYFKGAFYPVMTIIVLAELYYYLDGFTKDEYYSSIFGENDEAYNVSNYGMLRKILLELFPERHLINTVSCDTADISESHDLFEQLLKSQNETDKLVGEYFDEFHKKGNDIDISYIRSCINLMNNKSTVVLNPFYRDFGEYLVLPLTRTLINYGKVLVITGRESISEEVKDWLNDLIVEHSGTRSLWKCDILNEDKKNVDIGILRFSDIYDLQVHEINKEFLNDVSFVLVLEPSRIISSAQVGLNIIAGELSKKETVTYCVLDRNCDGIVDTLSHVFMTNMVEVTASLNQAGNTSQMYWKADGDYMHYKLMNGVSRYLGNGTELSMVALKYQLKKTLWVSDQKFPVKDIKWIDGQYYKKICEFINMPAIQESFNDVFKVSSNLWNNAVDNNSYIIAEDEFRNMFETSKLFASRGNKQSFVNVISENYLLRDYMADNSQIFANDSKMIPTIIADYARSERNIVIKLIMKMANTKVSEEEIAREMTLCGIDASHAVDKFCELVIKHCDVDSFKLDVEFIEGFDEETFSPTVKKLYYLSVNNPFYIYTKTLGNAYYIAEDELDEKHYITAKLYCHIFQDLLPGQFMCYDGKYYEVQAITPENGVIVRRAADHIDTRHYYRQIRDYSITNFEPAEEMGSRKSINEIETEFGYADITVKTDGYYDMHEYGDLKHARKVDLNGIPNRYFKHKSILKIKLPNADDKVIYTICTIFNEMFRTIYPNDCQYITVTSYLDPSFENKHLCSIDGDVEKGVIYVIEDSQIDLGLLISVRRNLEKFLAICQDYLRWHKEKLVEKKKVEVPDDEQKDVVIPKLNKPTLGERIKGFFGKLFKKKNKEDKPQTETVEQPAEEEVVDSVMQQPTEVETNVEQVQTETIEESQDDIQPETTVSIEESLEEQHETIDEVVEEVSEEQPQITEEVIEETSEEQPETIDEVVEEVSEEQPQAVEEIVQEEQPQEDEESDVEALPETVEEVSEEQTQTIEETADDVQEEIQPEIIEEALEESENIDDVQEDEDDDSSDEQILMSKIIEVDEPTDYQLHGFMKFGFDEFDSTLGIDETIEYIDNLHLGENIYTNAREALQAPSNIFDPNKDGVHYCDFCGTELAGGEYEVLTDGRERCNRCSRTAVKNEEEFKEIYKNVLQNMEAFFGIRLGVAVQVRMVNAKKMAKLTGQKFVATPQFDGRTLGLAKKDKEGYSLFIESGAPKLAAIATIAHELTHIWQYLNWKDKDIVKKYGKKNKLIIYEGMAKWIEIQYMYLINEHNYAYRQDTLTSIRTDEYGIGFNLYKEHYTLAKDVIVMDTPFKHKMPLGDEEKKD